MKLKETFQKMNKNLIKLIKAINKLKRNIDNSLQKKKLMYLSILFKKVIKGNAGKKDKTNSRDVSGSIAIAMNRSSKQSLA